MTTLSNHGNAVWLMRAIAPALLAIAWSAPAIAQVRSESGSSTQVNPGNLTNGQAVDALIRGGDARGQNLFHRFRQFDIPAGSEAYFANPAGIENILGRVNNPMGTPSQILGTLGVDGPANLFLLDSNGILFGENARLDVQGSFFASTADDVRLENGVRAFESLENNITADDLTVDPRAFLFNQLRPDRGGIQVVDARPDPEDPTTADRGLVVPNGESLILLGANVEIDNSYLSAPGGRVQLGAVADTPDNRAVRLRFAPGPQEFRLRYPGGVEFGDVTLRNDAVIDVAISDESGLNGGNIEITGEDIGLFAGAKLCAGVGAAPICGGEAGIPAGSATTRPGNILIQASDSVTIRGIGTRLGNNITPDGQIDPEADIFEAVGMFDASAEEPFDVLFGSVLIGGDDIVINQGAQLSTSTEGAGSAGAVVLAGENISLDGAALFSNVLPGANGDAGGIIISAGSTYSQINGGIIEAGTSSVGEAGQIIVSASDITLSGPTTAIRGSVFNGANGDAGNIIISASSTYSQIGGAMIRSDVFSDGRTAGNVEITAPRISLDDSTISTSVVEARRANAGTISLTGAQINLDNDSVIFNNVEAGSSDSRAGFVLINSSGEFNLLNGSQVQTIIRGFEPTSPNRIPATGDNSAGIVAVFADDVNIDGTGAEGLRSSIFSSLGEDATGVALVRNAGIDGVREVGGLVFVFATGDIILSNSGLIDTNTSGDGPAGAIQIAAGGRVELRDGSLVTTSSFSETSDAGEIRILSGEPIIIRDGSAIAAVTDSGDGGDIIITAQEGIILFNGGQISTRAGIRQTDEGNGGNISIEVQPAIFGLPLADSNIIAQAFAGDGGRIDIRGTYIFEELIESDIDSPDSNDISASSEFGADGRITTNELDFEPVRNIVEVPAIIIDTDRLIAQACPGPGGATDQIGEFYVTGRGGIPAGLNDATLSDRVLTDWITVDEAEPGLEGNDPEAVDSEASDLEEDSAPDESSRIENLPQATPVVEAERLVRDRNGDILLLASASGQVETPGLHVGCPAPDE